MSSQNNTFPPSWTIANDNMGPATSFAADLDTKEAEPLNFPENLTDSLPLKGDDVSMTESVDHNAEGKILNRLNAVVTVLVGFVAVISTMMFMHIKAVESTAQSTISSVEKTTGDVINEVRLLTSSMKNDSELLRKDLDSYRKDTDYKLENQRLLMRLEMYENASANQPEHKSKATVN